MSQIEVSPGGIGFIRTPPMAVPGVPSSAKRQYWVTGGAPVESARRNDAAAKRPFRGQHGQTT